MKNSIKGMSLIEVLLSLTILSIIALTAIQIIARTKEAELNTKYAQDIAAIMGAIDKRLVVDGLSDNHLIEQLSDKPFSVALNRTFISKDSQCGAFNGWEPIQTDNVILLPCHFWKTTTPYGLKVDIIDKYSSDTIKELGLDFFFNDNESFEKNSAMFIRLENELSKIVNSNMVGVYNYSFVNKDTGQSLNKMECFKIKKDCSLRATFKVVSMFSKN